jgi:FKBP-type peptidyl-prolyl cis-trans isomerase FkpA
MKKSIIASLLLAVLVACGGKKGEENALPLNSEKQKISYLMGADNAGQLIQDPNFAKYNKEEILKGFEVGLNDEKSFDQACQKTIQDLLGPTQQEFNEKYVKEASLCIGKFLGGMFKTSWTQAKSFSEFEKEYLVYGFKLGINKNDTLIKPELKQTMLKTFMEKINGRVMTEVNKKESEYFSKVKTFANIQELPNGLFMETIQAGKGANPTASSDVKAHYVLLNVKGDTLQSSLTRGPQVFNLNGVIPGWTVGIPFMKKGGKYKLYVPQAMAYGKDSPDPNTIPPFSTLVFYIELIDMGPAGTVK